MSRPEDCPTTSSTAWGSPKLLLTLIKLQTGRKDRWLRGNPNATGLGTWYKGGPSKRSLCLGFRHVLDAFFYVHSLVSGGRIKGTGSWEASAIVLVLPSGGLRQATSTCLGLLLPLRNVLAALKSLHHDCVLKPAWPFWVATPDYNRV